MSANSKIHLVGSAHLDPIWLWRWQEGCGEVLQTFRSALDRLNEYSEYRYDTVIRKYREKKLFDMYAVLGDRANMRKHIAAYADKPLKTRAIVGLRTCFPKLSNTLKDTYRKIRK